MVVLNKKVNMKKYVLAILTFLFFIVGCEKDEKGPLVKNNTIPGLITNIKVENMPGSVKISYDLPEDLDLLYVVATYTTEKGETVQAKSSVFKKYLILEGFAEPKEYTVKLHTVDRSENYSPEVLVKVNPLEAPIHQVFREVKVEETFGGVHISVYNELEAEYILYTLLKDSITGEWFEHDRFYTQSKNRDFYSRGFPSEPTEFAFFLTDKWQKGSDTLFTTLTPIYEIEIVKSDWKDLNLKDDFNEPLYGPLKQLWTPGPTTYFFQNNMSPNLKMPTWISIDLGDRYKFSRFKMNQVSHSATWIYSSCTPLEYEIWVSNEPTTDWMKWTFLGNFRSVKPSGQPIGSNTEDDLEANKMGEEHDLLPVNDFFRYVRFKVNETWSGVPYFCALELTFWGQSLEENEDYK